MPAAIKAIYTARTHTSGGREHGICRSSDGHLDIMLTTPGQPGAGTNPEQLFAAGWSACFEGAIGIAARRMKLAVPLNVAIDAEVDLNFADGGYYLSARLHVRLPDMSSDVAQLLIDAAHATCPYSKAVRGNIAVAVMLS